MQKSTANYSQIKDITMGACIVLIVELLWMTCGNLNTEHFKFEEAPYQGKIDLKENEDKSQVEMNVVNPEVETVREAGNP